MSRLTLLVGLLFAATGCGSAASNPPPVEEPPPIDDTWQPEGTDDHGNATIYPVLEGRAPKRLSVDQLRQVVPQLLDGQTWYIGTPFLDTTFLIPMFELMGPTLGEADYLTTSVNFLDPIPSFMKYVDEMSATVCLNTMFEQGNESLVKYPEDVDKNLRYLRLKFHGVYVPEGETEGIAELRTLYDGLFDRYGDHPDPTWHIVPWLGVCTAILTDPEFYIY